MPSGTEYTPIASFIKMPFLVSDDKIVLILSGVLEKFTEDRKFLKSALCINNFLLLLL